MFWQAVLFLVLLATAVVLLFGYMGVTLWLYGRRDARRQTGTADLRGALALIAAIGSIFLLPFVAVPAGVIVSIASPWSTDTTGTIIASVLGVTVFVGLIAIYLLRTGRWEQLRRRGGP